jgi:hypothetical protein
MNTPNYVFEGTDEQKAYAAEQVHNRVRAETRLTNGKAALWYMGGFGVLLALIGLGVGLAFWGYARYADVSKTAEKLAETLGQVLSKVTVETRGEVTMRDGEMVLLDANGQTVKIEPGGTVALQSGGAVRVDGQGPVAQRQITPPTASQLNGNNPTGTSANVVTDFTIFKTSKMGFGNVVTGWKFNSSEQTTPFAQYCYYAENRDGVELRFDIATNGKMLPSKPESPVTYADAAAQCVWFDGSRTQTTASTPTTTPAVTPPSPKPIPSRPKPNSETATLTDWQSWCRDTYPENIQAWCLDTFSPEGLRKAQSVIFGPMQMDPVQRKAL